MGLKPLPKCNDSRPCFARNLAGKCGTLIETPEEDGSCKFCKPKREVTNGVKYEEVKDG